MWRWLTERASWFVTDEVRAQGPTAVARATTIVVATPLTVTVTLAPVLSRFIDGLPSAANPIVVGFSALCFLLAPFILRWTRSPTAGGVWMLMCAVLWTCIPAYFQHGLDSILMVWFLLIPMVAAFLLGARWTAIFTAISALVFTCFWFIHGIPVPFDAERFHAETVGFRWLNLLLALLTISVLAMFWEFSVERRERERERLEAQMRHSQKLETVGMLAGGIAHDFNNILAAILGHASILDTELEQDPVARRRVQAIVASSQRAATLVEQMLAYAGRSQTRTGAVDIPKLIRDVAELVRPGLDRNTELILRLEADTPAILADPIQIQQVVMNLLTNASESLGGKRGRVWVRCASGLPPARPSPWLANLPPDRPVAVIEVRDEGCGIDPDALDSIFDPFYTTKPSGHGLGLAAVFGVVRSHGGDIEVHSQTGEGTRLRVLLPCPDPEALQRARTAEAQSPRPRVRLPSSHNLLPRRSSRPPQRMIRPRTDGPGYILVVDDEEMICELAGEVLRAAGYNVLIARDGDHGLRVFERHAHEIDLLILDRTMPGLDGLELLSEIRAVDKHIPVILSSGYAEDASSSQLRELGVDAVLHKPWAPSGLTSMVAELTAHPDPGSDPGSDPVPSPDPPLA